MTHTQFGRRQDPRAGRSAILLAVYGDWGLVGRDPELERIVGLLQRGATGVFLVGAAGVGKSRLAAEVEVRVAGHDVVVVHVAATPGASMLPLGSLAPLLPADAVASGLPVLPVLRGVLRDRAGGRRMVISVDDAHHLDDTSAVLIHQLVTNGDASLIATQRHGSIAPEPMVRLWQDGVIERVELPPLDRGATAALGEAVAGSPLDDASTVLLWNITEGNPLFIREVLLAARESGALVVEQGEARVTAVPTDAPRLVDFVRQRVGDLAAAEAEALLMVAVGEPVGPGELPGRVTPELLAGLEASELISTSLDDKRLVIRLVHPLFGEVLRSGASPLQLRTAQRELAVALLASGARRRYDTLRLATWSLAASLPVDRDTLVRAARTARFSQDFDLARDLAELAWEEGQDFDTGDLIADILYELGDAAAIAAHRPAWEAQAGGDDDRIRVEMNAAITAFWREADDDAAWAALDRAEGCAPSAWRDEASAVRATLLAVEGLPDRAIDVASPLVDRDPDRVLIQAALALSHAYRSAGRSVDAVQTCDRALAAYEVLGEQVALFTARVMGAGRSIALADAGRLDDAEEEAEATIRLCRTEGEAGGIGLAALVEGWVLYLRGRMSSAVRAYTLANSSLVSTRHPGMQRWALAGMALAQATAGNAEAARAALAAHEALGDHPARIFDGALWRARAWLALADGDPERARDLLVDGAVARAARGDRMGQAGCLHDLARLGRPDEAAEALAKIAADGQGDLLAAMSAHAAALVSGRAEDLGDAADRLGRVGTLLWAAEAGFAAAEAARREGDPRVAAAWSRRAADWRDACEAAATPGLVADLAPVPLTRREREVAILAAQGLAAREIGERLFVSRRTVESHLARVYDKLGIRSRAELAVILDGA